MNILISAGIGFATGSAILLVSVYQSPAGIFGIIGGVVAMVLFIIKVRKEAT